MRRLERRRDAKAPQAIDYHLGGIVHGAFMAGRDKNRFDIIAGAVHGAHLLMVKNQRR